VTALLVNGELKNIGKAEAAAQSEVAPSFKFLEEIKKHHKTRNQGNPRLGRDSKCSPFQWQFWLLPLTFSLSLFWSSQ